MTRVALMIIGGVLLFGVTAVFGLVWAIRHGQMSDFSAGAGSIFDEDEPIGEATDKFPGESPPNEAPHE